MDYVIRNKVADAVDKIERASGQIKLLGFAKTAMCNAQAEHASVAPLDRQREELHREVERANLDLDGIVNELLKGSENWRRLMGLVDGNDTWDAASVLSHFSMDPKNETELRGDWISSNDIKVGDTVDACLRGELVYPGVQVLEVGHDYLRSNFLTFHPGIIQMWNFRLVKHAESKPELPTEPGTIFRVLEFDGKPFEALAHVDADGDFVTITVDYWPNEEEWIKYADRQRITKFELVDVVTKESA